MLLERIDVHAGGALDPIQLGPFSHRLNAVYGPPGSGKTAILEFLRAVMPGGDRSRYLAASGSVVWADREGLIHCRRDTDGTSAGTLAIDYVARDGMLRDWGHEPWNASVIDHHHAAAWQSVLPRPLLDTLVAPRADTPLEAILRACRDAGLDRPANLTDPDEMARMRRRLDELDRELAAYPDTADQRPQLESRRQALIDYLAHLDHQERTPPEDEARRLSLETRAADAKDEIERLRLQETELRKSLADVSRQLADLSSLTPRSDGRVRIAAARRIQLEELDSQLGRLCQALREIRTLQQIAPVASLDATHSWSMTHQPTAAGRPAEARRDDREEACIRAVRRSLDALVRFYQPIAATTPFSTSSALSSTTPFGDVVPSPTYLDRSERDEMVRALTTLDAVLESIERGHATGTQGLARLRRDASEISEGARWLVLAIQRLVDARGVLLRQVAREHQLSMDSLLQAFGDWRQCHDAPHVYEWLLGDSLRESEWEARQASSRRAALEQEQRRLLDELSRSANRLDDLINELRVLEARLEALPPTLPIAIDHRRRVEARDELAELERRLRWLDSCHTLEDERRHLRRRLESMMRPSWETSPLMTRASYWLDQLSGGYLRRISASGSAAVMLEDEPAESLSAAHRQTAAMALRMAATESLQQRGTLIPLMVDEPCGQWLGSESARRMANILAKFTDGAHQMIVFTSSRELASSIRYVGGQLHQIAPSRYYHLRLRDAEPQPTRPSSQHINRELDTVWREANGLYDDPHWYRSATAHAPLPRRQHRPRSVVAPLDASVVDTPPRQAAPVVPSPFFLTEDSPIDSAPSIDAVAAARLHALGVDTVGDLLAASPRELAEQLELADVTATVVQRWQHESGLVCGVPQLRNFDARVLVGCGFTDPMQLARMHPGRLLERVEAFLATERGRQILRSGTSYELSRITSWIAAANRSVARSTRHGSASDSRGSQRRRGRSDGGRASGDTGSQPESAERRQSGGADTLFCLHYHSPIADAPAIGPKTAERLRKCGYASVQAFLDADPTTVQSQLNHPRITRSRICQWQLIAALACAVPGILGQDAHLLVLAGVRNADRLAKSEPSRLLAKIDPIARSAEGKRILRGAPRPTLATVRAWVESARLSPGLRAA